MIALDRILALNISLIALGLVAASAVAGEVQWRHLSSRTGDLPAPGNSNEQTVSLILGIDRDGVNDFVIAARQRAPSLVWCRRTPNGWTRHVIGRDFLPLEAGGTFADLDGDGRLDILAKPYTWDTPRINLWLNQGIRNP